MRTSAHYLLEDMRYAVIYLGMMKCLYLFLLSSLLLASEPTEKLLLEPGLHVLPGPMHAGEQLAISVVIPPTIHEPAAQPFPVCYVQAPNGKPTGKRWRGATDQSKDSFILVSIPKVRNGMPDHDKMPIQDKVIKWAHENLPIDPHLQFAIGISGGGADSQRMVRRQPQKFAGIVMIAVGLVRANKSNSHIAHAYLSGAKDRVCTIGGILKKIAKAETAGFATWSTFDLAKEHAAADLKDELRALRWALWHGRLHHPSISDERRTAFGEALGQAVNRCVLANLKAADKAAQLADWLYLAHGTETWFAEAKRTWLLSAQEAATALPAQERAYTLGQLLHSQTGKRHLTDKDIQALTLTMGLYAESASKLIAIEHQELLAGLISDELHMVITAYQDYQATLGDADSFLAKQAQSGIERCKPYLEKK